MLDIEQAMLQQAIVQQAFDNDLIAHSTIDYHCLYLLHNHHLDKHLQQVVTPLVCRENRRQVARNRYCT